jgi:hypothetical protein
MKLLETVDDIILSEAIKSLEMVRKYEDYTKKPYVVEQVNAIVEKLKTLDNFIGTNRNGKRLYFTTDYEGKEPESEDNEIFDSVHHLLDNLDYLVTKDSYKNGYAQDKSGRQIKIGKLLTMFINKVKDDENHKEYLKKLLQAYNQDPVRLQGQMTKKKKLIVMSTANYDIAGMTQGRSWENESCMRLDSAYGQGGTFVHCDILFGTIVVYLVNEDDKNIENPLGRTLVKPYINISGPERDVYYATDPKEYGGQTGFNDLIDKIFRDLQEGKEGRFRLHHRLSNQGRGEVRLNYGPKVIDQKYVQKLFDEYGDDKRFGVYGYMDYGEYDTIKVIKDIHFPKSTDYFTLSDLRNLTAVDNVETNAYTRFDKCEKLTTITNIKINDSFCIFNECPNIAKISGHFDRGVDLESINITSKIDLTEVKTYFYSGIVFKKCTITSLPQISNDLEKIYFDKCKILCDFPEKLGGGYLTIKFRNTTQEDFLKIKFPENKNYRVQ